MVASSASERRSGIFAQLWFQVVAAMLIGILTGLLAPGAGAAMKPLGDAFIALVRMMIGPIIFVTVVHGIAGLRDMRRVGRLAFKSIVYFEAITLAALLLGLMAVRTWQPGTGMNIDPNALDTTSVQTYLATARAGLRRSPACYHP